MLASGDARDSSGIPGYEAARDHIALDVHGLFTTHVDALSHMFVRGEMFGGRPASDVRSDGARSNTVLSMADGVVGRGVLLDVPRALGRDFLDTGEVITVDDLETTERGPGRRRVGPATCSWWRGAARPAVGPRRGFDGFSGLHAECLPWLHEREVAVLGSDGISDPMPFVGTPDWPFPGPSDRDHRHGPAPHRQHGAGAARRALRRRRPMGVPLHHGAVADPRGHGMPGEPGGGPVTPHEELRALLQRYARAADERDVAALAELFHPDAEIVGSRGTQSLEEWLETMRAPRAFPTSMHMIGDPLDRSSTRRRTAPRSTPTPSCTS